MREDNHAMELNGAHINPPIPTSIYHSMRRGLEDACLAGGRSKPGRHRQSASLRVRDVPETAIDPARGAHAGAVFVPHTSSHPYCG